MFYFVIIYCAIRNGLTMTNHKVTIYFIAAYIQIINFFYLNLINFIFNISLDIYDLIIVFR